MGITAWTGPLISFGAAQKSSGSTTPTEYNSEAGPSLIYQGVGYIDPRYPYSYTPGNAVGTAIAGWIGTTHVNAFDGIPTVISTNSVAQTQTSTTTTTKTLTLTASNTNNVTINQSIIAPETGQTVTGLRAIDGVGGRLSFGQSGTIQTWDPSKCFARCLTVTTSSDDSAGAYTFYGRDVYGFKMQETIAGPNAGTGVTQKAFKYITTITASGTINSTGVIVGVSDVFGLPLYGAGFQSVSVYISSALVTASTGVTGGSTRTTQTSTTPDVRGTWSSTIATDGSKRFTMYVTPSPVNINSTGYSLIGAPQYYSS